LQFNRVYMTWFIHSYSSHLLFTVTTTTIGLWPCVWYYPGELVPEETFTHSYISSSSTILYQLSHTTMIHSILPVNLHAWQSFTLTSHIHLTMLISARWSATSFSFLIGQVSLPCNILLHTQLLYSLPVIINDISLLLSNGTNCLNLFHPVQNLASTAAPATPPRLNMSSK